MNGYHLGLGAFSALLLLGGCGSAVVATKSGQAVAVVAATSPSATATSPTATGSVTGSAKPVIASATALSCAPTLHCAP